MSWYHFQTPHDAGLDELAARFRLHPLHMEDVRSAGERVKVEGTPAYTFALLKTLTLPPGGGKPTLETISLFASHAQASLPQETAMPPASGSVAMALATEPFFIVIADTAKKDVAAALRRAGMECDTARPSRLLYLTFDSLVDSYFPVVNAIDEEIDALEDRVVKPARDLLNDIFAVKRRLVDARRLLGNTRDACMHLQRDTGIPVTSEQQMYLRDLYDHISRLLDTVESQRDLLNNALDIYLSSIANRTNEVMKVLTVLSTVALPALVVTGIYGMNVKGLPFVNSNYAAEAVAGLTLLLTAGLLALLRHLRWF